MNLKLLSNAARAKVNRAAKLLLVCVVVSLQVWLLTLNGVKFSIQSDPQQWSLCWGEEYGITIHAEDSEGFYRTFGRWWRLGPVVADVPAGDAGLDEDAWIAAVRARRMASIPASESLDDAPRRNLPCFTDYPVTEIYTGPNVLPAHKFRDWSFKTGIPDAIKNPPNFAGHYLLAVGSCGVGCHTINVIDAKTGDLYKFPYSIGVGCVWFCNVDDPEIVREDFRLHSRLIRIEGGLYSNDGCEPDDMQGTHYFIFDGKKFVRVAWVKWKQKTYSNPKDDPCHY